MVYLAAHVLVPLPFLFLMWLVEKLFTRGSWGIAFYILAIVACVFPDFDHLFFWRDVYWKRIFPFALPTIGFPRYTTVFNFLHFWIYPFLLLTLAVLIPTSSNILKKYLLALVFGWSFHLCLDGIVSFV